MENIGENAANKPASGSVLDGLTPREREVATLIHRGLTNREIAAALFIEEQTVKTHVKHILRTTGCAGRVQVVARMEQEHLTRLLRRLTVAE